MSRIKILYTIPNFNTAGSQYVVISIFKKLNLEVFDPYICVESYPELIPSFIPENRKLIFTFSGNKFQDFSDFRKLLRKNKIDIIHSWDYKSNYLEALFGRLSGTKYLYTKKNNSWSNRWQLKSFFADHIAYDNPEMKEIFFASSLFRNKISFVPHGVDTDIFKPLEPISGATFNLGCIGNIGSNKNQLFIFKALKELPENIVLQLYGKEDKEYRKILDSFIKKHNLQQRIFFLGFIKNNDIPEVLRSINIFVLASINEGMPVSILEAQASGVPVLSSNSGGGTRHLLHLDNIFSLENTNELIKKILYIYNLNEDLKSVLIKNRIQNIKDNFSIEKEIMAYEDLYKRLA